MPSPSPQPAVFTCNARRYTVDNRRFAIICLDGSSDEYINAALAAGVAPALERMIRTAGRFQARSAMPSFTNPNNSSIITGVPPAAHGIGGNYFLDRATGKPTMMNSAEFLAVPTILAAAQQARRRPCVLTAKDKLRAILSKGMTIGPERGISLSSEKSAQATPETAGIPAELALLGNDGPPEIYSADASVWVLELGAELAARGLADLLYLSTTDFIQHAHAPHEPEAIDFYRRIDRHIARLLDLGVTVGITADHGMNAKVNAAGEPDIVFLEPVVRAIDPGAHVILPITDPYVVHHASLGSFAQIYLADPSRARAVADAISALPGVTEVLLGPAAHRLLELPAHRGGEIVVIAGKRTVLGTKPADHDLSTLRGSLRSHGGRYEELVPLLFSTPLHPDADRHARRDPRNFDVFDLTINGTRA